MTLVKPSLLRHGTKAQSGKEKSDALEVKIKILCFRGHSQEGEKTSHRIEESICK
jgi:hypothetical protein